MTIVSMNLIEAVDKCGDSDLLRQLAEAALVKLMEFEVEQRIGAGLHERVEARSTYRNGYRDRTLDTRLGTLNLPIPKLRSGTYFPSFLEPRAAIRAGTHRRHPAGLGGRCPRPNDGRAREGHGLPGDIQEPGLGAL